MTENDHNKKYRNKYHIIGDSAFALQTYMMVPLKDTGNLDGDKL